jgi:hypothetical protein
LIIANQLICIDIHICRKDSDLRLLGSGGNVNSRNRQSQIRCQSSSDFAQGP